MSKEHGARLEDMSPEQLKTQHMLLGRLLREEEWLTERMRKDGFVEEAEENAFDCACIGVVRTSFSTAYHAKTGSWLGTKLPEEGFNVEALENFYARVLFGELSKAGE